MSRITAPRTSASVSVPALVPPTVPSTLIVAVIIALVASGCASVPTGPSVMVMPGTGKTFEAFQVDDAVCRQWAAQQTGTTPGKVATDSTVGGAAIGTLVGAAAGAALGAAAGNPGLGAAAGAGVGLLGGTARRLGPESLRHVVHAVHVRQG